MTQTTADCTALVTPSQPRLDPDVIVGIASGFMAAMHLFAGARLGVFEALGESPAALPALAARTGLTIRGARLTADALVALGLLERDGDLYRNSAVAAACLAGGGPRDLRPLLRLWDEASYPAWTGLAEVLGTGSPRRRSLPTEHDQELISAGIAAMSADAALALSGSFDFSRCRRLLDVGGGTGSWSVAVVRRHPHLRATVLDSALVAEAAGRHLARAGLAERITVLARDVFHDPLPAGHDVFLVANLVHQLSADDGLTVLQRLRAAAPPGAWLLLADFWTDASHTRPLLAALMAGDFALHCPDGDVYSTDEVRRWLSQCGWRFVDHQPLATAQSVITAEAV